MPKNYINRIGLECEGGWYSRPPDLRHDGSVDLSNTRDERLQHIGEIGSPPYARLATSIEWLRANHPVVVNETCGFHIHVSLSDGNGKPSDAIYSRLMCNEFFQYYLSKYAEWGEMHFDDPARVPVNDNDRTRFITRLAGRNRYCLREFHPDTQAACTGRQDRERHQARYCMLNFCYSMHGTMESRLLPMFKDPNTSVSALECFINIINTWLEMEMAKPSVVVEDSIEEQPELLPENDQRIVLPDGMVDERIFSSQQAEYTYDEFIRSVMPSLIEE